MRFPRQGLGTSSGWLAHRAGGLPGLLLGHLRTALSAYREDPDWSPRDASWYLDVQLKDFQRADRIAPEAGAALKTAVRASQWTLNVEEKNVLLHTPFQNLYAYQSLLFRDYVVRRCRWQKRRDRACPRSKADKQVMTRAVGDDGTGNAAELPSRRAAPAPESCSARCRSSRVAPAQLLRSPRVDPDLRALRSRHRRAFDAPRERGTCHIVRFPAPVRGRAVEDAPVPEENAAPCGRPWRKLGHPADQLLRQRPCSAPFPSRATLRRKRGALPHPQDPGAAVLGVSELVEFIGMFRERAAAGPSGSARDRARRPGADARAARGASCASGCAAAKSRVRVRGRVRRISMGRRCSGSRLRPTSASTAPSRPSTVRSAPASRARVLFRPCSRPTTTS